MSGPRWMVLALPLGLLSCHPPPPVAFTWKQAAVRADGVPLGTAWTVEAPWEARGVPELVQVMASCQCVEVTLADNHGKELRAGDEISAAAGTARVRVIGKQEAAESNQSVTVVWRSRGSELRDASTVQITVRYEKAYEVTPGRIDAADLAPGTDLPFEATWRALRPVVIRELSAQPVPGIECAEVRSDTDAGGTVRITVRGVLRCPDPQRALLVGHLAVQGLEPLPPSVLVHATWQRLFHVEPGGVVRLSPTQDGPRAEARIRFATVARASGIRAMEVEPLSPAGTVDASWSEAAPGEFMIQLKGRFEESAAWAQGTVRVTAEAQGLGEIRIPWLYLKPRGQPR